ncbi:hypothetical protein [Streptomyces noursei]|uniref:hypothetical protein n=1 Tax=Streptomyces noursei TaxID=1971 RepID=UPI003BF576F6
MGEGTRIRVPGNSGEAQRIAGYLAGLLRPATGFSLPVTTRGPGSGCPATPARPSGSPAIWRGCCGRPPASRCRSPPAAAPTASSSGSAAGTPAASARRATS